MDRDRDPGHRPADRRLRAEPGDRQLPLAFEPRRHRKAGGGDRVHRTRRGAGRHRRRHRPLGRIDVRADRLLRALHARRSGLAGRRGDRRDRHLRRAARRRQRLADRLPEAEGVHHDPHHADHLPVGVRPPDPALLERYRLVLPGLSVLELHRRRRGIRRAEHRHRLSGGRHLRPHLHDPAEARLAHHRHRRLAPLRLQFGHRGPTHDRALLRRLRGADRGRRPLLRRASRHGRRRYRRRPRSDRADRDGARRHHAWRRQGLGDEVGRRHADRASDHQRAHDHERARRLQSPGARRAFSSSPR